MTAIRYQFNGCAEVVTLTSKGSHGWVTIRLHGGKEARMPWLGFVCTAATQSMPEGAYAKMLALQVSNGDPNRNDTKWIDVEKNQYVLCWRVLFATGKEVRWGVYGLVNDKGCPIVMVDKSYTPPQGPQSAKLLFLDKSKKQIQSEKKLA